MFPKTNNIKPCCLNDNKPTFLLTNWFWNISIRLAFKSALATVLRCKKCEFIFSWWIFRVDVEEIIIMRFYLLYIPVSSNEWSGVMLLFASGMPTSSTWVTHLLSHSSQRTHWCRVCFHTNSQQKIISDRAWLWLYADNILPKFTLRGTRSLTHPHFVRR